MFAKMCILEKIPTAFDAYIPPKGMNVSWYYDFKGKQNDNQVIGFFTTQEISINEDDVLPEGSIQAEVQNNRCFHLVEIVKQKDWDKVIKDFTYQGQISQIPKDHPRCKPEWHPKQKKRMIKAADGSETEELLEFEAEVDQDVINKMNALRDEVNMEIIQPDEKKIRKVKGEGMKKPRFLVMIPHIKVIDEIKEEK